MGTRKSRKDLSVVGDACCEEVSAQTLREGTDGLIWPGDPAVPMASYDLGFSAV